MVTFDDGYADNLLHAAPLLERYEVPATVFVTTGRLGEDGEFWWDDLERMLLRPGRLPRSLHLELEGSLHSWDLGEAITYTADQARCYSTWKAWETAPTARHSLYGQLYALLNRAPPAARVVAVEGLRAWAGVEQGARRTHRALSIPEVRALDRSGVIELGAHTVNHPNLAALDPPAQAWEIQQSKAHLELIVGHQVDGFAYPFGRRCDYTARAVAQVRASGFRYACSNDSGLAKPTTDRLQVPRMQVHDWDGGEFSSQLNRWFGW
jgi:peptidoglycan/xylan/chitin deacetylase (PgdA/CDA1 family)